MLKQNDNLLENRTKLVPMCKMGHKVFMNCAGFIKIDTQKVSERTDAYVELLDGSRVHPETYEWARKMAIDALEYDDTGAEEVSPTFFEDEILENRPKTYRFQRFVDRIITLFYVRRKIRSVDL